MSASSANTSRSVNGLPANSSPVNKAQAVSQRVYRLLLLIYPLEFRREYGPHMAQLFRDCCRAADTRDGRPGLWRLWLRTLLDLVQTAPKEHLENLRKENSFMKNLRSDALAFCGCIGIIIIALVLLTYGRNHNVSAILFFGYALDAVVTTGVIGNLIVFLLVKTTSLNPLRTALWTFLVVHAAPVLLLAVVGSRIDPQFRFGSVLIGYVVSFLFWFGVHWIWSQTRKQPAALA
jgi:hypothetical protein